MANGKKLSIDSAKAIIKAFEQQETGRGVPLDDLAIGQKLDLAVLEEFLAAIKNHSQANDIDAIRIYIGRTKRTGHTKEHYDLVLVPVLKNDDDLHKVYDRKDRSELDTIVGNTLPCPNVCPDKAFFC
jgi:hypothetical protein